MIMDKTAEYALVVKEADAWFERNKDILNERNPSIGIARIADFYQKFNSVYPNSIKTVLEIGASFGYNLKYFYDRMGLDCYGFEASNAAVSYGNEIYGGGITLKQGLSRDIQFDDEMFDSVIIGFSLYTTPRDMVLDSIKEFNRVLKKGGFLCITDFDTPNLYMNENKHCSDLPVFKRDYAKLFIELGYTLIEKYSWYLGGDVFNPKIQERVSTQILYKEPENNIYIKNWGRY